MNDTGFAVVDGVSVVAAVCRVIRFGYFEFKCQIEKTVCEQQIAVHVD